MDKNIQKIKKNEDVNYWGCRDDSSDFTLDLKLFRLHIQRMQKSISGALSKILRIFWLKSKNLKSILNLFSAYKFPYFRVICGQFPSRPDSPLF